MCPPTKETVFPETTIRKQGFAHSNDQLYHKGLRGGAHLLFAELTAPILLCHCAHHGVQAEQNKLGVHALAATLAKLQFATPL